MGGRGQNYTIITRLPNHTKAKFPRNKFKNYILNPSKSQSKADFFKRIGYNMKNYKRLQQDIKNKLATNKALKYDANDNGDTMYQVNMLLGIDGHKRMVATAWIVRKGDNTPQFVTAYPNHKLKGGR